MKKSYGFFAVGLGATLAASAIAQGNSPEKGAQTALTLEEVMVTARKVEENLQKTPLSVTALSGQNLDDRGALSIIDAGNIAPNVALGDSASFSGSSSAPTVFIRGIGQADFLIVNDPAVGIYLDGVYVARSIGGLVDLLDLERAEILRGPQGTLFGRNTIGGAINLISKKPDGAAGGKVFVTLGEDKHREVQLVAGGALADNVFARLSALYRKRDGYVDALQYDDLKLGEDHVFSLRGQLRFLPTANLSFDLAADYSREREAPAPTVARNIGNIRGGADVTSPEGRRFNTATGNPACLTRSGQNSNPACFGRAHLAGNFASNSVWTDEFGRRITPENALNVSGISATLEWDTPSGRLKSIAAWRQFDSIFYNDLDFSPHTVFHNINHPFDQDQFSWELQYGNDWLDGRLSAVTGVYYFEESGVETVRIARARAAFNLNGNRRAIDNESVSLYAQGTWSPAERLHLTAGLRYTDNTKLFTASVDFQNRPDLGPSSGVQTAREVNKLITLGYDISDDRYLYLTFSDGFRDGGFPARFTGGLPDPLPFFDPEFVDSWEVGLKNTFFDKRLRANISAFHTLYDDMQITATAAFIPGGDVNTSTDNLANVSLTGVELEIDAVLTERFKVNLNMGWLDDDIKQLDGGLLTSAGFQITRDTDLPYTPKLNWNLGASYAIDLPAGSELLARIDWKFVDEQFYRIENLSDSFEDAYNLVNASIQYTLAGARWELVLGVRNLNDEQYATTMAFSNIPQSSAANINRPRTVYGTFRYFFGDE